MDNNHFGNYHDPLFKGATRPAMMFGVPLVPLVITVGVVILISVYTIIWLVFALVPIVMIMRSITKHDDQQFRLLGLKFIFRWVNRNKNGSFWKASAYSPIEFEKRK